MKKKVSVKKPRPFRLSLVEAPQQAIEPVRTMRRVHGSGRPISSGRCWPTRLCIGSTAISEQSNLADPYRFQNQSGDEENDKLQANTNCDRRNRGDPGSPVSPGPGMSGTHAQHESRISFHAK